MTATSLLSTIRARASAVLKSSNHPRIRGIWDLSCDFRPSPSERAFRYRIVVAQTVTQGSCYYSGSALPSALLSKLVGCPYSGVEELPLALEIALLDSLFKNTDDDFDEVGQLTGTSTEKAHKRSNILCREVDLLIARCRLARPPRVAVIGVVSLAVLLLHERGYEVRGADLDQNLIGTVVGDTGITVEPGEQTLALVRDADVALVSGMTLSTGTLDEILEAARSSGTRVVLFAQTGSNLAAVYRDAGIDTIVSEPFPFYIFDGTTRFAISRRGRE